MKHAILRSFMRNINARKNHVLKDCPIVIEGDSYFRGSYKESGCQFILGGEFDRYADHLRRTLTGFIESNVTCYVIFNGGAKADVESRKEVHQKLIDEKICIVPGDDKYYEPVFVKDVQKQVLEELDIRYYVCEYDARETLLDVSKEYNCPVITNNIEYCLLGLSCITPNSITYDKQRKQISCKIQIPEGFQRHLGIFDNMKPIFMTILDEDGPLFEKIPEIIGSKPSNPVGPLVYWIKRQRRDEAINDLANKLSTEAERKMFRESVDELRKIIFYKRNNLAVKYFQSEPTSILYRTDKDWFKKGVMIGRIAIPYINLKNNGTFSGSWVICDKDRDDAMLPALDIVMYAYSILSNSQKSTITFIGRISDKSCHDEIACDFKSDVSINGIFEEINTRKINNQKQFEVAPDLCKMFVDKALPGFDWSLLKGVPEDCWLLIITLLFYISKADRSFISAAYSILLSYVMLGPVSERVGLIKRSNLTMSLSLGTSQGDDKNKCTYKDCLTASHAVINYFYEGDIKKTFNRSVLHGLAEFQHCLQQINYLNKLCGERIKCTNYYKTYNGTFVYNVLLRLRENGDPMVFIESHFKGSPSVLQFYKHIKEVFENCLDAVGEEAET